MNDNNPTTRRYSRTMSDAFPDIRACAIEHHRPKPYWRKLMRLTVLGVSIWLLLWQLCSALVQPT